MATKKKTTLTFYNKYNRHELVVPGQTNNSPSQTVPGEELTIAELLRMSARGELPPMAMSAFHGIDVDIDMEVTIPQDPVEIQMELEELRKREQVAEQTADPQEHVRSSAGKDEVKTRGSAAEEKKNEVLTNEED